MPLNPSTKRSKFLTAISGVSAGGATIATVDTGQSIDSLKIRYTESGVLFNVNTGIARVRLVADGRTLLDQTPLELLDLALINGYVPKVGELPIFFTEPSRASIADEEISMLDLRNYGSCHLEIRIAAGRVNPGLNVVAMSSLKPTARNEAGQQFIAVRETFDFSLAGAGTFNITDLPKNKDISRIMLYHPAGITRVELSVDGEIQNEMFADENESELEGYGFSPAATSCDFPLIFTIDQKATSAIRALRSLVAKVTVGGAGTLTAVVESFEPSK